MERFNIENIYISAACNNNPNILTAGNNNIFYYGTSNAVAVYDQNKQRVVQTACGHTDEVRSVRYVMEKTSFLISTSKDNSAIIWDVSDTGVLRLKSNLIGHEAPVSVAHGLEINVNDLIIVTTANDFTIKVWRSENNSKEFKCIQTMKTGASFCIDVKLHILPESIKVPILACAMDDFKIGIYVWENNMFHKKEIFFGHEDWVCSLDWTTLNNGDILLASGSQDAYIRLWRISHNRENIESKELVSQLKPDEQIKAEIKIFISGGNVYEYRVDSVLYGHSSWVHSVSWHPKVLDNSNKVHQPVVLLSSSMDASVCVWEPDPETNVWSPSARLGLMKEDSLGIQGCVWGSDNSILAHTIHGSLHKWHKNSNVWENGYTVGGGHFREVVDLCWEPSGEFLLTTSTDQTTRIHAPWPKYEREIIWHELARPQVHGYDFTCISAISKFKFASGAEEKIIRCFQASKQFKLSLKRISRINVPDAELEGVQAASLPVLGLTNLSLDDVEDDESALLFHGIENISEPLREEILWRSTLWPEERKLYGHGYELYCLASSHNGNLLASASKAAVPEHAGITLWDTRNWQEIQKLTGHQLTVTQMAFSPDDQYLLSVSRDRRFCLFKKVQGENRYTTYFASNKENGLHSRIIWTCCWAENSKYFATGSRDGLVVVWKITDTGCIPASSPLSIKNSSVTALSFAPITSSYILTIGTEDGNIFFYKWTSVLNDADEPFELLYKLDNSNGHHKTVRRLQYQPKQNENLILASCGNDFAVKLHVIKGLL